MGRTWSFVLVAGLGGCVGPVVDVDSNGAGESDDGDAGSAPEPTAFDPGPDIGDNTLAHDLLVVAELEAGTLTMVLFAQRSGDSLGGHSQTAFYIDGEWLPAGLETPIDAGSVVSNEVSFAIQGHRFPAGQHPFGPDEASVDLDFEARFYGDQLLCGTVVTTVRGEADSGTFVARPLTDFDGERRPVAACQ